MVSKKGVFSQQPKPLFCHNLQLCPRVPPTTSTTTPSSFHFHHDKLLPWQILTGLIICLQPPN
jgi:hypothetical protein